jgi:hypothetical protein
MNRPLIRAYGTETIACQIGTFTDAHAGVTNQQKSITAQIVAAEKFLLEELILLFGERAWQPSRATWNVLAADEMREFGKLVCPSQFIEDAAQMDEKVDTGCCRQWRRLRTQARHPAEHVWIAAQLVKRAHLRITGAKIGQEVAGSPTIVTSSSWIERGAEGLYSTVEDRRQPMLERGALRAVHDDVTGSGRMCWATARAY